MSRGRLKDREEKKRRERWREKIERCKERDGEM